MLTTFQHQTCDSPEKSAPDFLSAYEELLDQRNVLPKARPYFLRWAKLWSMDDQSESPSGTIDFFQALGRRPNLPAWQFTQAVRAVAWLARDILN